MSISGYGPHVLRPVRRIAGPFEWVLHPQSLAGHGPDYASTRNRSDGRISVSPPCLVGLLEQTSDTALPSSDAIRWMARCGLRRATGRDRLALERLSRCWLQGKATLGLLQLAKFRGFLPSLALRLTIRCP